LPISLSLVLFPELGVFSVIPVLVVFALGALVGTITHIYWIRTLVREAEFYKKFYDKSVLKPHKNDHGLYKKHTMILLPFYAFAAMMFIIIIFVFGIFGIDVHYLLPLMFGALDGIPISYFLMKRWIV